MVKETSTSRFMVSRPPRRKRPLPQKSEGRASVQQNLVRARTKAADQSASSLVEDLKSQGYDLKAGDYSLGSVSVRNTERYASPSRDQRDEVSTFSLGSEFRDDDSHSDITDSIATYDNIKYKKSYSSRSEKRESTELKSHNYSGNVGTKMGISGRHADIHNRASSNSFRTSSSRNQGISNLMEGNSTMREARKGSDGNDITRDLSHKDSNKHTTTWSRSTFSGIPESSVNSRSLTEAKGFKKIMIDSFDDSIDTNTFSKMISEDFSIPSDSKNVPANADSNSPRTRLFGLKRTKSSNINEEKTQASKKSATEKFPTSKLSRGKGVESQSIYSTFSSARAGGFDDAGSSVKISSRDPNEPPVTSLKATTLRKKSSKSEKTSGTELTARHPGSSNEGERRILDADGSITNSSLQNSTLSSYFSFDHFKTEKNGWHGTNISELVQVPFSSKEGSVARSNVVSSWKSFDSTPGGLQNERNFHHERNNFNGKMTESASPVPKTRESRRISTALSPAPSDADSSLIPSRRVTLRSQPRNMGLSEYHGVVDGFSQRISNPALSKDHEGLAGSVGGTSVGFTENGLESWENPVRITTPILGLLGLKEGNQNHQQEVSELHSVSSDLSRMLPADDMSDGESTFGVTTHASGYEDQKNAPKHRSIKQKRKFSKRNSFFRRFGCPEDRLDDEKSPSEHIENGLSPTEWKLVSEEEFLRGSHRINHKLHSYSGDSELHTNDQRQNGEDKTEQSKTKLLKRMASPLARRFGLKNSDQISQMKYTEAATSSLSKWQEVTNAHMIEKNQHGISLNGPPMLNSDDKTEREGFAYEDGYQAAPQLTVSVPAERQIKLSSKTGVAKKYCLSSDSESMASMVSGDASAQASRATADSSHHSKFSKESQESTRSRLSTKSSGSRVSVESSRSKLSKTSLSGRFSRKSAGTYTGTTTTYSDSVPLNALDYWSQQDSSVLLNPIDPSQFDGKKFSPAMMQPTDDYSWVTGDANDTASLDKSKKEQLTTPRRGRFSTYVRAKAIKLSRKVKFSLASPGRLATVDAARERSQSVDRNKKVLEQTSKQAITEASTSIRNVDSPALASAHDDSSNHVIEQRGLQSIGKPRKRFRFHGLHSSKPGQSSNSNEKTNGDDNSSHVNGDDESENTNNSRKNISEEGKIKKGIFHFNILRKNAHGSEENEENVSASPTTDIVTRIEKPEETPNGQNDCEGQNQFLRKPPISAGDHFQNDAFEPTASIEVTHSEGATSVMGSEMKTKPLLITQTSSAEKSLPLNLDEVQAAEFDDLASSPKVLVSTAPIVMDQNGRIMQNPSGEQVPHSLIDNPGNSENVKTPQISSVDLVNNSLFGKEGARPPASEAMISHTKQPISVISSAIMGTRDSEKITSPVVARGLISDSTPPTSENAAAPVVIRAVLSENGSINTDAATASIAAGAVAYENGSNNSECAIGGMVSDNASNNSEQATASIIEDHGDPNSSLITRAPNIVSGSSQTNQTTNNGEQIVPVEHAIEYGACGILGNYLYQEPTQGMVSEKKGVRFSEDLVLVREIPALPASITDTGDSSSVPSDGSNNLESHSEAPQVKRKMFRWFRRRNGRGWRPRGSSDSNDSDSFDEDSASPDSSMSEDLETTESITSSVSHESGEQRHRRLTSVSPTGEALGGHTNVHLMELSSNISPNQNLQLEKPLKSYNQPILSSENNSEDASNYSIDTASVEMKQEVGTSPKDLKGVFQGVRTKEGKASVTNRASFDPSSFGRTTRSRMTYENEKSGIRKDAVLNTLKGNYHTIQEDYQKQQYMPSFGAQHNRNDLTTENEGIEMIARQANNGKNSILIANVGGHRESDRLANWQEESRVGHSMPASSNNANGVKRGGSATDKEHTKKEKRKTSKPRGGKHKKKSKPKGFPRPRFRLFQPTKNRSAATSKAESSKRTPQKNHQSRQKSISQKRKQTSKTAKARENQRKVNQSKVAGKRNQKTIESKGKENGDMGYRDKMELHSILEKTAVDPTSILKKPKQRQPDFETSLLDTVRCPARKYDPNARGLDGMTNKAIQIDSPKIESPENFKLNLESMSVESSTFGDQRFQKGRFQDQKLQNNPTGDDWFGWIPNFFEWNEPQPSTPPKATKTTDFHGKKPSLLTIDLSKDEMSAVSGLSANTFGNRNIGDDEWQDILETTETLTARYKEQKDNAEDGNDHRSISEETIKEVNEAIARFKEHAARLGISEKELMSAVRDEDRSIHSLRRNDTATTSDTPRTNGDFVSRVGNATDRFIDMFDFFS